MPNNKLKPRDKKFAKEYIANGNNAKQAVKETRPHLTEQSAEVTGSRLLSNVKVQSYINQLVSEQDGGKDKEIINRFIRNAEQTKVLQASNTANIELAKLKNLYPSKDEPNNVKDFLKKITK